MEAGGILAVLLVQIALGGLVAGLKAGLVYDTWPLIDGVFIPAREKLMFLEPAWTNLLDNHLTVQFTHRIVAYLLIGFTLLHALDCIRGSSGIFRLGASLLATIILSQATLGVVTLLWHVPLGLALLHQAIAVLALVVATIHFVNLRTASASSMVRTLLPAAAGGWRSG
jgi:cytochrome c oxidase assembly protein subunit 15